MTDDAAVTPRPKLRPPSGRPDTRPTPAPAPERGARPPGRVVPVRWVLLGGLAVLLGLAATGLDGLTAVVALPLALTVPGAVLQPRLLPALHTDAATRWCLRVVLSLATWTLVGLAGGAAGVPVRSVWPVVVAVVLLAAVLVGEPERERRFGWVPVRAGSVAAGVLVVAVAVAFGGRALVAVAGGTAGPTGAEAVTVAFADPVTPFALTATGARATARVVVTNAGAHDLRVSLTGAVGRGLAWTPVDTAVPAGGTRTVEVTGAVPVCSDSQQALVTVDGGGGDVVPLAAVLPGTDGAPRCGAV